MSQERPPLLQVYTHFTFSSALLSQDRPPLLQVYTHFTFSSALVSQDRPLLTTTVGSSGNSTGQRYYWLRDRQHRHRRCFADVFPKVFKESRDRIPAVPGPPNSTFLTDIDFLETVVCEKIRKLKVSKRPISS
jgi:hypothetical protein